LPHIGVSAGVAPEEKKDEDRGEVGAGNGGGDAGADYAEHWEATVPEDEEIVSEEIDEIGRDEGEGYRADQVHALKSAAEGEVEKQRDEAKG